LTDFVLASTSPRRHALLREAGYLFSALDPGDDGPGFALDPGERVLEHAEFKARSGARQARDGLILASDTLVWCAGEFLPKPDDRADAARMLRLLDSREHEVWTGVCVLDAARDQIWSEAAYARVRFGVIPQAESTAYLASTEWCDKAGAYAIQGTAGRWCKLVEGDYNTVVGLPLGVVSRLLAQARACSEPNQR
jgi:nucleoside triphosphate pyrophosphatase